MKKEAIRVIYNTRRQTSLKPWWKRLTVLHGVGLIFLIIFFTSLWQMPYDERATDWLANVARFGARLWPPDFSIWPEFVTALGETMRIAVIATMVAFVLSLPIALGASRNVAPMWVSFTLRMFLNGIRTVPSLLWAIVAVAIWGITPWAGVAALTVYSVGYLGKFYSDAIESVDLSVAYSLRGMGAHPIQALQYGLWPMLKPLLWSQALWMLEYNIRSASIIGYVGAGGLGMLLNVYQDYYQWTKVSAVLIFLLFLVILLDVLGEWLRGKMNLPVHRR
ncbi:MAG: phosphonate ABC transporter, permease protein PhnE [Methylacidiphilales bacterium]|nr:phosphonate ABC transporter, permease protein PhnE [Candidatus Methylacidiphilales bacterium]MDW8349403.1 phosphonate ABC transporter, permease protein PhnE [Verrucomicrobiae bacterium]